MNSCDTARKFEFSSLQYDGKQTQIYLLVRDWNSIQILVTDSSKTGRSRRHLINNSILLPATYHLQVVCSECNRRIYDICDRTLVDLHQRAAQPNYQLDLEIAKNESNFFKLAQNEASPYGHQLQNVVLSSINRKLVWFCITVFFSKLCRS